MLGSLGKCGSRYETAFALQAWDPYRHTAPFLPNSGSRSNAFCPQAWEWGSSRSMGTTSQSCGVRKGTGGTGRRGWYLCCRVAWGSRGEEQGCGAALHSFLHGLVGKSG